MLHVNVFVCTLIMIRRMWVEKYSTKWFDPFKSGETLTWVCIQFYVERGKLHLSLHCIYILNKKCSRSNSTSEQKRQCEVKKNINCKLCNIYIFLSLSLSTPLKSLCQTNKMCIQKVEKIL